MTDLIETERAKYAELWSSVPDYRAFSPGMDNVERFMEVIQPDQGQKLIDIGCGTGKAGLEFVKHGLDVWWLDITDAGLDAAVPRLRFVQNPLWQDWPKITARSWPFIVADYGYCCDVMEHIPTEYTMLCLDRIMQACDTAWFQITLLPDNFSATIGQQLHLTVRPFNWWLERLRGAGKVVEARDLCGCAVFVVTR